MKKLILFLIPILGALSIIGVWAAAPMAVDDTATTDEDMMVEIDLTSNDTDVDLDTLTVTSLSSMMNGTGEINLSGTGVNFTPDQDFNGMASFDYTVSDGTLTDTGSVTVTVDAVNDAPMAVDDTLTTTTNNSKTIDPRENDTDVDGDALFVSGATDGSHGTVTFDSMSVTYMPDEDYEGTDSFTYIVSDGILTDTGTIFVMVMADEDDDKHEVKTIQKEFINKFKELKAEYKDEMGNRTSRNEYLELKKDLRGEYKMKLKEATGANSNNDLDEDEEDNDDDNSSSSINSSHQSDNNGKGKGKSKPNKK